MNKSIKMKTWSIESFWLNYDISKNRLDSETPAVWNLRYAVSLSITAPVFRENY